MVSSTTGFHSSIQHYLQDIDSFHKLVVCATYDLSERHLRVIVPPKPSDYDDPPNIILLSADYSGRTSLLALQYSARLVTTVLRLRALQLHAHTISLHSTIRVFDLLDLHD